MRRKAFWSVACLLPGFLPGFFRAHLGTPGVSRFGFQEPPSLQELRPGENYGLWSDIYGMNKEPLTLLSETSLPHRHRRFVPCGFITWFAAAGVEMVELVVALGAFPLKWDQWESSEIF